MLHSKFRLLLVVTSCPCWLRCAQDDDDDLWSWLLSCLFLIHQGPSLRQTHTLTKGCHHSNKREKAEKDALWGGRRREYSEMEGDREGVSNPKRERVWYKEQTDGEAEKERQMAEKDSGCFSPAVLARAKMLTSSDFDNRRCQPLTPSFSRCFSHTLFISVSSVNFVSNKLTLSGWASYGRGDTVLLVGKLRLFDAEPYCNWATPNSCRSPPTHTQTHLAFTWILGDWCKHML